ncbi:MAG: hypothetical protein WBF13_13340 [Candidatus Zixiibacteriota bacterium]
MKSELAAGDSTWIELIYTAGGAKSRTHKSARVTTNDTTLGSVSIAFKAEVKEPGDSALLLAADPPALDFGDPEGKRVRELESKIKNVSDEVMRLELVSVPPDIFKKVELNEDKLKPGKTAKLKVELKKGQEEEQFRKSVTLEARYGEKGKFRLTVPLVKGIGGGAEAKKDKKDTKEKTDKKDKE